MGQVGQPPCRPEHVEVVASSVRAWKRDAKELRLQVGGNHGRKKATDARFETMIGRSSWVDGLFVWFPAAWMPLVMDPSREKNDMYNQSVSQLGTVAFTDQSQFELPRHKSLATGASGGRRTKLAAALSYNHASTSTGSQLTRKCLLLFSPDCTKESFMMFSYRRQR